MDGSQKAALGLSADYRVAESNGNQIKGPAFKTRDVPDEPAFIMTRPSRPAEAVTGLFGEFGYSRQYGRTAGLPVNFLPPPARQPPA